MADAATSFWSGDDRAHQYPALADCRGQHPCARYPGSTEIAVAATKSYVNSIVAGLAILAEWTGDEALRAAVQALPGHFEKAVTNMKQCGLFYFSRVLGRTNF